MHTTNVKRKVTSSVGTIDQAINEQKIFTTKCKMPAEVQKVLLNRGWIGRNTLFTDKIHNNPVHSLHKNQQRVKEIIKRYAAGLIWTDGQRCGVDWSTLRPGVVVNRFPRDGHCPIELCGPVMTGANPEFNKYYPRAHRATAVDDIAGDYSLTACASLMRAFVDGIDNGSVINCTKNRQSTLSALHFAINNCNVYVQNNGERTAETFSGKGPKWESFFEYYYRIAHEDKRFMISMDDEDINCIVTNIKLIMAKLNALRPQMAIDGIRNVWIVKSKQSSFLLNKLDDILEKCNETKGAAANLIVQKYIETPLPAKNMKFDLQTWIVISTIDNCLTVWLYQMCCLRLSANKFTVNAGRSKSVKQYKNSNINTRTCNLKKLKSTLRSMGVRTIQFPTAFYGTVKKCVASSVSAVAGHVLNLRPNCIELFQSTFVVDRDLRPWLIDIKSDPCMTHPYNHTMSSLMSGLTTNLAKIITTKARECKTNIGLFDLVRVGPITGNKYKPRTFNNTSAHKHCSKIKSHKKSPTENLNQLLYRHYHNSNNISTYIENIKAEDVENPETITLSLADLKHSMNRLNSGSRINTYEAQYCMHLLDRWKTRVLSAQQFYKSVLEKNKSLISN